MTAPVSSVPGATVTRCTVTEKYRSLIV